MTATPLTVDTLDQFGAWLATVTGPVGFGLTPAQMALADASGEAFVFNPNDSPTFTAQVIDTIRSSGKRPWAEQAGPTALRIARAHRVHLNTVEWLRDATAALYTVRPDELSKARKSERREKNQDTIGLVNRGAAANAVNTAKLMLGLQADSPKEAIRAALDTCRWEAMWRPRQLRGWRVDTQELEGELARALESTRELGEACGVDLLRASSQVGKREALAALNAAGIPLTALNHAAIDDIVVADLSSEAQRMWAQFRPAYSAKWRVEKLREIKRESDKYNGRVYSTLLPRGTKTGRASSSNIALQNIPRDLRHLFMADEGDVLVALDLSNAEPRVAAALSGDTALLADIYSADGIYTSLARRIWGDAAFDTGVVIPELRERAKTTFLQTMYGAGPKELANKLGVSSGEGKQLRDDMWAAYPVLDEYRKDLARRSKAGEPLTYTNGRPMPTPKGTYALLNAAVQGEAADLFYAKAEAVLSKLGAGAGYLPIHDELVLSVPVEYANLALAVLREEMTGDFTAKLTVSMSGEAAILGRHWRKV